MTESHGVITPSLSYRDPRAAIAWLQAAFGLELCELLTTSSGEIAHCEMAIAGALIGIMGEWSSQELLGPAKMMSPASLGGAGTQFLWIDIEDTDSHCARARGAGARIIQEPQNQFYGARTYRALDPEGHVWNFRQTIETVSREEMEKRSGLKFQVSGQNDD